MADEDNPNRYRTQVIDIEDHQDALIDLIKRTGLMFTIRNHEEKTMYLSREGVSVFPSAVSEGSTRVVGDAVEHEMAQRAVNIIDQEAIRTYDYSITIGDQTYILLSYAAPYYENGRIVGSANLCGNITEYRRQLIQTTQIEQERIELARKLAEQNTQVQRRFLSGMSHEFRTPLTAIIGNIDLLWHGLLTEAQRDFVTDIKSNAVALMGIVNDILDTNRYEQEYNSQQVPEIVEFDITQIVSEINATQGPLVTQKGLLLETICLVELEYRCLYDNYNHILQVLVNLVSNAIKFTFNGNITVTISRTLPEDSIGLLGVALPTSGILYFGVKDTGIGLMVGDGNKIFSPFSTTGDQRFNGSGLGLAIVSTLVSQMGGDYGVKSKRFEGSTFWFWIPYRAGKGKAKAKGKDIHGHIPWVQADQTISAPHSSSSSQHSILIAEDNAMTRKMFIRMVESLGYNVMGVQNGYEMFQVLNMHPTKYDACLVDLRMPIMDGYDLAHQVRQSPHLSGIPLIAMTAHAVTGEMERCRSAGFSDFLPKPFTTLMLKSYLDYWSARSDVSY